ncbi:MAG: hypothetical protein JXM71_05125 [Spirochaetales bacterium]|nr:hypothetical protein [Spirochaetales bacterium]
MKLSFCKLCGRLILRAYPYCPYCGSAQSPGPGLEEAVRPTFARLEEMQADLRASHIEELLESLEGLESAVEEILSHVSTRA